MAHRTLVIDGGGTVVNVVVTNGGGDWQPPDGCTSAPAPDGVGIGWTRQDDGSFAPPAAGEG